MPALPASAAALRRRWREMVRRVYEVDPLVCPRCGDLMRVVAFINARSVIRRILDHLARRDSQGRDPPI